jgi:hypothetical protein
VYGLKKVKDEGQQYLSFQFARSWFDDMEDDEGGANSPKAVDPDDDEN